MVPKLHKKGSSFKGAATYLLHDKERAKTNHRVAWIQTRNIAVNEPDIAWRIMAATAIDQDRLKQQANIKSTGRKSKDTVLHLSLSWHPDENERLTQREMELAANGALRALGAEEHQALIIAHNDEAHPHLHILLNRVNPNDGKMLSSSKEKLNLSRWAEVYERERGQIYCEERVLNNEARDRGEYTRDAKVVDRRKFEEIRRGHEAANDDRNAVERERQKQRKRDKELSDKGRSLHRKHRNQWADLTDQINDEKKFVAEQYYQRKQQSLTKIRDEYRIRRRDLLRDQVNDVSAFAERETRFLGRAQNTINALRVSIREGENEKIADLFDVVTQSGVRRRALEKQHIAEKTALNKSQRRAEAIALKPLRNRAKLDEKEVRTHFLERRDTLIENQKQERNDLQSQWRQRHAERSREWHDFSEKMRLRERVREDFENAAAKSDKEARKESVRQRLRNQRESGRNRGREKE